MYAISNNYKSLIENSLSLSPKSKIVVDNTEYDGSILKTYPKITHKNSTMIGGFPAKTCSFEIYDINNNLDFEGKEITVYRGLDVDGTTEWIPQGIFIPTADKITTNISTKTIAFNGIQDKSQLFDLMYESNLNWSDGTTHTGLEIVQEICTKLGITLETTTFNWYNYSFKQPNFSSNTTYREVINRIAQIGGSIAYISRTGGLVIKSQTSTGHSIARKRYSKLSKEKQFGLINVVVLGKDGINDDIVYPSTLPSNVVEFKILDNPFVDLYREEMIETVASYIIGQSIIPFTLNDFVDGFYLDLNDTIQVTDKNNNVFNAAILNYESTSRIKSNIGADVQNNSTTNYNLAGSNKKGMLDVKADVDHIKGQINLIVEEQNEQGESIAQLQLNSEEVNIIVSQTSDTLEQQQQDITNINTNLNTTNQNVSSLQGTVNNQATEIGNLNTQIGTTNQTVSNLQGTVNTQTGQISNLNGQVETANQNISNLQGTVGEQTESINHLNEDYSQLEQSTNELNTVVIENQNNIASQQTDISNLNSSLSSTNSELNQVKNDLSTANSTINEMKYTFTTDELKIQSTNDPINSALDNQGIRVYNYTTLKSVLNDKGSGFDDLIVTNTAQIGYLKFVKATDENNEPVTDIHHLVSNIQNVEDLL